MERYCDRAQAAIADRIQRRVSVAIGKSTFEWPSSQLPSMLPARELKSS
jgi:hypothetical protein